MYRQQCEMDIITSMTIYLLLLFSIADCQGVNFTQHTYIIPTDTVAPIPAICLENSNETQCVTLNELIDSAPGWHGLLEKQEKFIFLSGVHVVNGTATSLLSTNQATNLMLSGESNNVTIVCLKEFTFIFVRDQYVKVSNLTLVNCCMGHSQVIRYSDGEYCCNFTFLFIGLVGSIILENIQIRSS